MVLIIVSIQVLSFSSIRCGQSNGTPIKVTFLSCCLSHFLREEFWKRGWNEERKQTSRRSPYPPSKQASPFVLLPCFQCYLFHVTTRTVLSFDAIYCKMFLQVKLVDFNCSTSKFSCVSGPRFATTMYATDSYLRLANC